MTIFTLFSVFDGKTERYLTTEISLGEISVKIILQFKVFTRTCFNLRILIEMLQN